MGCFYRLPRGRQVCGLGRCIEDFILADGVRFRLGSLSIETLDRGRPDRNAYEQSHRMTFHDFLLFACQLTAADSINISRVCSEQTSTAPEAKELSTSIYFAPCPS